MPPPLACSPPLPPPPSLPLRYRLRPAPPQHRSPGGSSMSPSPRRPPSFPPPSSPAPPSLAPSLPPYPPDLRARPATGSPPDLRFPSSMGAGGSEGYRGAGRDRRHPCGDHPLQADPPLHSQCGGMARSFSSQGGGPGSNCGLCAGGPLLLPYGPLLLDRVTACILNFPNTKQLDTARVAQSPASVASGAFDPKDMPNLVWPQIAASEVSLTKDG